jgi:hypothetical protein
VRCRWRAWRGWIRRSIPPGFAPGSRMAMVAGGPSPPTVGGGRETATCRRPPGGWSSTVSSSLPVPSKGAWLHWMTAAGALSGRLPTSRRKPPSGRGMRRLQPPGPRRRARAGWRLLSPHRSRSAPAICTGPFQRLRSPRVGSRTATSPPPVTAWRPPSAPTRGLSSGRAWRSVGRPAGPVSPDRSGPSGRRRGSPGAAAGGGSFVTTGGGWGRGGPSYPGTRRDPPPAPDG